MGPIKTGQSRDTGDIGHKTKTHKAEYNTENYHDEQHEPLQTTMMNPGTREG